MLQLTKDDECEPGTATSWQKRPRIDGAEFVVTIWHGPFPHEYDWEAHSLDGVMVARCLCTKSGDVDPVATARRYIRQLPKQCQRCRERAREVWCELWRLGSGNWRRMTAEERQAYAKTHITRRSDSDD